MPESIEFGTAEDFKHYVLENKAILDTIYSSQNNKSTEDIAETAVGQNTYRGIHGFIDVGGPKHIFTKWARDALNREAFAIASLHGRPEYDQWLESFADDLRSSWPQRTEDGERINYGQSRKLTNLLLGQCLFWNRIDDDERKRLLSLLHVPLDEYVLVALRKILASSYGIRLGAQLSMSSVTAKAMYDTIQRAARDIAQSASVPPFYLDVWPLMH